MYIVCVYVHMYMYRKIFCVLNVLQDYCVRNYYMYIYMCTCTCMLHCRVGMFMCIKSEYSVPYTQHVYSMYMYMYYQWDSVFGLMCVFFQTCMYTLYIVHENHSCTKAEKRRKKETRHACRSLSLMVRKLHQHLDTLCTS